MVALLFGVLSLFFFFSSVKRPALPTDTEQIVY